MSLILTVIKGQWRDPPPWDIEPGLDGEGQLHEYNYILPLFFDTVVVSHNGN